MALTEKTGLLRNVAPARQRTSCGPCVTARNDGVMSATAASAAARSSRPVVARRHSLENTTCVAIWNRSSDICVGRSASSTTVRPRSRAATQIGRTKSGKRLSARTTSAHATRRAGSSGFAAASLSSRWVTIMRSPRASRKIAESAVGAPAMRWQPLQSICSRASAARTRSPFKSSPGGPPSGPASTARPPSRAIATAALAAQPPLTMKKLCAWVFASGCGKRSTRNTSSSTIMPAHKIARALLPALAELNLFLHPGADDVVGDGHGRRRGQAAGMTPQQHARDRLALEPAGVVELRAIDDDLARERLGMTADHQRGGKGPGLRGEITHASANDAGLFARFPPHGVFDRLPGLDETREARPHAGLKAMRAAEHAALARDRKHDHDRIRAGKMLRPARGAIAPPAGFDEIGRGTARRAKAMAPMPVEERFALGEGRQMLGLDQAADRDRAEIGDDELVPCFEHLRGRRLECDRESRRLLAEAEKNQLRGAAKRARFCQCEQWIGKRGCLLEDHQLASNHIGARARIVLERRERSRIHASLGRALDRACGITETRLGAEIGAGGHGMAPAGIDVGPAVLCHVEGSQSKRASATLKNIALRATARGSLYWRGAASGAQTAQAPRSSSCPRLWTMHRKIRRRSSTNVRTAQAFPRSIRPIRPRPCTGCWPRCAHR